MPIVIRPFTNADRWEMTLLVEDAFKNDPFHQSTFPEDMTPAQLEEFRSWRANLYTQRASKSWAHYFVAIDDVSRRIVGFIGWHGPMSALESKGERWPDAPTWLRGFAENAEMFKRMRQHVLGDRQNVWVLQAMAVHPDFQRQGIARKLIEHGFALVDQDGLDCYVEATHSAATLYKKTGFEPRQEIVWKDGKYIISGMLRPAKGTIETA